MNDFDNKQICSYKDIDRFGFTCDVCGRKVNGCHYINGMKFCAKCYQETFGKDNQQNEIQQLKQQLEEKDNYHLRYELAGADETITNLKEQLAEKDIRIEELEGQFAYECECNKQLVELQKQLEEKQKTINEINKEFVQAVHDWKTLRAEKDKEIEKLKTKQKPIVMHSKENYYFLEEENIKLHFAQKQLAIQELSEVERLLYESHYKEIDNRYYAEYEDIKNLIDSRIQALEELKGEKDVKD